MWPRGGRGRSKRFEKFSKWDLEKFKPFEVWRRPVCARLFPSDVACCLLPSDVACFLLPSDVTCFLRPSDVACFPALACFLRPSDVGNRVRLRSLIKPRSHARARFDDDGAHGGAFAPGLPQQGGWLHGAGHPLGDPGAARQARAGTTNGGAWGGCSSAGVCPC